DQLHLLKDEGFVLGVEAWTKASALLEAASARGDELPRVRIKLAALLTKSPEEQQRFYRLFDEYVEGFARKPQTPPPPPQSWWQRNQLAISMLGLFLLLAGSFTYWYIPRYLMPLQAEIEVFYDEGSLQAIARDRSSIKTYPPFFEDRIVSYEWQWDSLPGTGEKLSLQAIDPRQELKTISLRVKSQMGKESTAYFQLPIRMRRPASLNVEVDGYELSASLRPREAQLGRWRREGQDFDLRAKRDSILRSLKGQDPNIQLDSLKRRLTVKWELGDGNVAIGPSLRHTYAEEDSGAMTLRVFLEKQIFRADSLITIYDTIERNLSIPKINPIPPVPVSRRPLALPNINDLRKPVQDYFLILMLTLLALLVYGLYEILRSRREKLVLSALEERAPPLQQHLEVALPDTDLFRSDAFDAAANELRARRQGEAEALDVP
ncbi:MAG: hypothetical protein AAFP02_17600, partial [Bacteroidota bacterium]